MRKNNYFPMSNEIFCLGLNSGEIAVYTYLMFCEDRKTFQCYPSYNTIGKALNMSKKTLSESMQNWLEIFKFPSVEQTTYDRAECTARNLIYPTLGERIVGDITSADIKKLLNDKMNEGYVYTTVKKIHDVLGEYFRYLATEELINKKSYGSSTDDEKSKLYVCTE